MWSPWHTLQPYPAFPLFHFLEMAASNHPDRPALLTPEGERWSGANSSSASAPDPSHKFREGESPCLITASTST